jgi:hypothetical protein
MMGFSLRHPSIKYVASGAAAILLIIVAVTPLVTAIVEGWSRRDVELSFVLALIGVAAGLGLLATVVVLGFLRGWQRSIKAQIEEFGTNSALQRGERTQCRAPVHGGH